MGTKFKREFFLTQKKIQNIQNNQKEKKKKKFKITKKKRKKCSKNSFQKAKFLFQKIFCQMPPTQQLWVKQEHPSILQSLSALKEVFACQQKCFQRIHSNQPKWKVLFLILI